MLSGCGIAGLKISNIDAYPPDLYVQWRTPGRSDLDTKKALLECGFKNPYNYGLTTPEDWNVNHDISLDVCMEYLGYAKTGWGPRSPVCSYKPYAIQKSCQPGADIIKPSVKRRLNNQFCKYERAGGFNLPECQP